MPYISIRLWNGTSQIQKINKVKKGLFSYNYIKYVNVENSVSTFTNPANIYWVIKCGRNFKCTREAKFLFSWGWYYWKDKSQPVINDIKKIGQWVWYCDKWWGEVEEV